MKPLTFVLVIVGIMFGIFIGMNFLSDAPVFNTFYEGGIDSVLEGFNEEAVWGSQGALTLADSLQAYYYFNESSGILIDVVSGYNGDNSGADRQATGINGDAYRFHTEDTDNVTIADGSQDLTFNQTGENYSVSVWFNITHIAGAWDTIIMDRNTGNGAMSYQIAIKDDGDLYWDAWDGAAGAPTITGNVTVTANEWHNAIVSVDDTTARLYLDNVLVGETSSLVPGTERTTGGLTIGAWASNAPTQYWTNGTIDEIGIWSKALNVSEINSLYNGGTGRFYPFSGEGTITLNAPDDANVTSNPNIVFNVTANPNGVDLVNISIFHNGTGTWQFNATNSSAIPIPANTTTFDQTFGDGTYLWTAQACDADGDCGFSANRTFIIDNTEPIVVINEPSGTSVSNGTLEINTTITDSSIDTCWYKYDASNVTFTCGTIVYTPLTSGRNLTVWANDTFGNINSSFVTWAYSLIENSVTYNASTFETKNETFYSNVTSNGTAITSAVLVYNGTEYTADIVANGTNYNLSATIDIPTTNESKPFYFKATIGGEEKTLFTNNQLVNRTEFALCNATFLWPYVNYTFANENNQTVLNGAIPTSNFTYYLGSGTTSKELIYSNTVENQSFTFCAEAGNMSLIVDRKVQYESDGHPQRIHEPATSSFTNTSTSQTLYLLPTADGIYVTFQVINVAEQVISDVFINASRLISATQQVVGEGFTDSSGGLTMWLNPDFTHNFVASKTGYDPFTSSFAPTQTSYTITLGNASSTANQDYTRGVLYNVTPLYNSPLEENKEYPFNFSISSDIWTIDEWGFTLANATNSSLFSISSTTNGGLLSYIFNVTNQRNLEMQYYWNINGVFQNGSVHFIVLDTSGTDWSINNTMTDFRTYLDSGMFGMGNFATTLLVFMVLIITVGIMSYKFGLTSPTAMSMLIFAIVLILDVGFNLMDALQPFGVPHFVTIFSFLVMASMLFRGLAR